MMNNIGDVQSMFSQQRNGTGGENRHIVLPDILRNLAEKVIGITTLDELLLALGELISDQIGAERSILFLNDARSNELYSHFAEGVRRQHLRFPNTIGVTGHVYTTGTSVIAHEAYADPRFHRHKDQQTGYVTRNLMCAPIRTSGGEVIGVLLILNRISGRFTEKDLAFLEAMTAQATFILSMTDFFEGMKQSHARELDMRDAVSETVMELDLDVCLRKVMSNAKKMLCAERATLFLHDEETNELFSRVYRGDAIDEIRFPSTHGIAGHVFTSGQTVNIPNAQVDTRFNRAFDAETGFLTRSVLCAPVTNKHGDVIGVSQVLNKHTGPFTYEDASRLKAFTAEISIVLENAQLFDAIEKMKTGKQAAVEAMSDGVMTIDNDGHIVTCNASGLRMMCATSDDVLHRPAHLVFTGTNTWVVDKLQHVADTHTFDMVMSSALNFGGHTQMVNMTLLPLVTAERSQLGSMIVIEALPH